MAERFKFHFREPQIGYFEGEVKKLLTFESSYPVAVIISDAAFGVMSATGNGLLLPIKETPEELAKNPDIKLVYVDSKEKEEEDDSYR